MRVFRWCLLAVPGVLLVAAFAVLARGGPGSVHAQAPAPADSFDAYFVDKTMRVDYIHAGGLGTDIVALDQVVSDGPWPGSRTRLVDGLNLGKYLFEVIDRRTNRVIYSRGFASIYGEWETTPENRETHRTFHESLRFPWPRRPVQVVLKVRDAENSFHEVWSTVVDPDSRFVNPADRAPPERSGRCSRMDPPRRRSICWCSARATRQTSSTSSTPTRGGWSRRCSRRSRSGAGAPTSTSGASTCRRPSPASPVPRAGEFRRTPLSAEYNIFDSERYLS